MIQQASSLLRRREDPDELSISDFENPEHATYVRWKHAGQIVYKQYASVVHAVVLASQDGVVIVEPYQKHPNNAVIYKADGTPSLQLVNPLSSKGSRDRKSTV